MLEFKVKKAMQKTKFNKHWQFCVGSCHAAMAMRTDYIKQLKKVHDELGMQYVRFHGIFCDDMKTLQNMTNVIPLPGGERFKEQSFHRCGIVYDNILEIGMKPFVELSFMPNELAKEPTSPNANFYGSNFNMPADFSRWVSYVQDFILYLLHRYGKEEVRTWYFEVWNEPDLQGSFFNGTQEDYFKLYEITAKAIKEIDSDLLVGGPATSGSRWIRELVEHCKKHRIPLDFVSTHQYAGDPLIGVSEPGSLDEERPKEKLAQARKLLDQLPETMSPLEVLRLIFEDPSEKEKIKYGVFPNNARLVKEQAQGLPVFYTEWNTSAIFSSYTNDTRKTAAYDVRAILDVERDVTGSSIWCFSDIFEELHQFTEEFHGGFGIQTLNGIAKPVYYALQMLADAGDMRIDLGKEALSQEVGIAAFEKGREKQIMLFRHKMKQEELPREKVYVEVEVDEKPQKVILKRIDENHCNPLRVWEEMDKPKDLNHAEINEIIQKSRMYEEEMPYDYANGILSINADLGVNDVYFIKIEY
ncbi:MAG: GH39 family glycosyl hydrolase [Suipraeoptans sp.]